MDVVAAAIITAIVVVVVVIVVVIVFVIVFRISRVYMSWFLSVTNGIRYIWLIPVRTTISSSSRCT